LLLSSVGQTFKSLQEDTPRTCFSHWPEGLYLKLSNLYVSVWLSSLKHCFPSDVQGDAVSEFSKDPADNSTNYCSLQNLMDGSDLINAEGYKQFSNKWICPGFDTANCTLS
uniref:Uncharacterized protein n=1 Tax=Sander lucioperca TaxID=283035 RepID=A0A8D0CUW4_SANLU